MSLDSIKTGSNGVLNARLATYAAGAGALLAVPFVQSSQAAVVSSGPVNISIPNSIDGVYFNLITGVTGGSAAAVPGYDINPYNNGAGLTFYGAATPQGVLATGTPGTLAVAQSLNPGDVVSPTPAVGFYNQFQTRGEAVTATSGTKYVGLSFTNEGTGVLNYGYLQLNVGAQTGVDLGFPVTITGYAYDNAGVGITIPAVPEPATAGLAALAIGAAALRRKRSA